MRPLTSLLFLLTFTACTGLKPVDLAPEYTPAPADAPLWDAVPAVRPGHWQVPLGNGPAALDWRLRAIDSATESIDLQTFLWSMDVVGELVLNHLIAAADRGVLVRILIDDTFLVSEDAMLLSLQEHPNIEYRVFNPYKRRSNSFASREILNLAEFHRLDHRMHNKAMVVDNRVAIVGGRNLADEYFGLNGQANFRDFELIIGGPVVLVVSQSFDDYWNDHWSFPIDMLAHVESSKVDLDAARQRHDIDGQVHQEQTEDDRKEQWLELVRGAYTGAPVLFVDNPPAVNPADASSAPIQVANQLVTLLDSATEEILIISAYLIPTPHLEDAIERAGQRGVEVRILTNSIRSNNHLAAHSAYRNHIDELMDSGAELHEVRIDARDRERHMFPPTDQKSLALHAKMLIIDDDKVFIGSANLDPRSLRLNTEMGLLIESNALNAAVRAEVMPDFAEANAWKLEFNEDGDTVWVSEDMVLTTQPAGSFMQRIEDWMFAHLPIEGEM